MARNKKFKVDKKVMALAVVAILALMFAGSKLIHSDIMNINYTYNGSGAGADTFSATGGGSGGGGGAPTTTGDDDGCVGECPAVWVEDDPIRTPSSGGLLDFFSIKTFMPALTTGEWTCEGLCKNEVELCLFDPTDVIPANGYNNPNNPPDCICLKPQPGACNFYDANYGVGEENIKCGGSCPYNSQCMRYNFGNEDVCRCLYNPYSKNCGLHYPEQYLQSSTGEFVVPNSPSEADCYGLCDIATLCTFDYQYNDKMQAKVPVCYCPDSPVQEEEQVTDCTDIFNPKSQADCDAGACKVLLYGVECLFGVDSRSGNNICYCGVPEDTTPDPTDDKLLTTQLTDTLSDRLDYFIR